MSFSEHFAEARRRQRAAAPRRALIKEAFEATRRLPGIRDAPTHEIRDAFRLALATRGVDDLADRSLDPMIRAIQTSRISVLADYALTGVEKTREVLAWLKQHEVPEWLNPPDRAVPAEPPRSGERALGSVDLEPRDLPLLARLLSEAIRPAHLPGEVDDLWTYFPCWLDLEDAGAPSSRVVVHVGKHPLGRLDGEGAAKARPELTRLARRRKALLAHGELRGSTPETVMVEVRLAVRSRRD